MSNHVRVVTFGEIMLRLKSPGFERFFQSPTLEATFGGGEANVSVSLANYGIDTAFVSVLPNNDIGNACLRELRGFGVDVSNIVRKDGRMGIYYLESGAVQRPSKVIYDRAGSAICEAKPGDIDWKKAFEGATWFHLTGITPAISEGAAELSLEAETGRLQYLVLGIGINVHQTAEDFSPEVAQIATSLSQAAGRRISRPALAAALIEELDRLYAALCTGRIEPYLEAYRKDCVNLGKTVQLLEGGARRTAQAVGIDDGFGLVVREEDGTERVVRSGEVSVRGLYGYVE